VALAKQLLAEQCATDLEELESAMKLGADPHPQRVSHWHNTRECGDRHAVFLERAGLEMLQGS